MLDRDYMLKLYLRNRVYVELIEKRPIFRKAIYFLVVRLLPISQVLQSVNQLCTKNDQGA